LESVRRRGGAEALDDELKYLAMRERWRMVARYVPVGLVMAILLALGAAASPAAPAEAGSPARLALVLVACLLPMTWGVVSCELRLLNLVDARAASELAGRFQRFGSSSDPHLLAVRRMADAVVQVTERLVQRQAELWSTTITAAQAEWERRGAGTRVSDQSTDRAENRAA
jgi:hypothetical protein